jgi:hypothetical protein
VRRFALTVAFVALGACTFAACEEVSVRDKSKDRLRLLDASIDVAPSDLTPPDDGQLEPSCIAQGAAGCTQSSDCCLGSSPDLVPYCIPSSLVCGTCKGPNAFCGDTDTCCAGGSCNKATGKCPNQCRSGGAPCDNDGQCCDVTDPSAKFECRADKKCAKCLSKDSICATAAECCRGLACNAVKKCAVCISQNATGCSTNDDCCDGLVCATDVDSPATTRCVPKCWPQWSIGNSNTTCKNGNPLLSEQRPCCAPFKCNFPIPSSTSLGCGP